MPPLTESDSFYFPPAAPDFSGRDRVLLYTRGMNLSPSKGVALALRSMRRAGEAAPGGKVMKELFLTLEENNVPFIASVDGVTPAVSMPPLNRRPMIAENMEQCSLTGAVKNRLISLLRKKRDEGEKR